MIKFIDFITSGSKKDGFRLMLILKFVLKCMPNA